MAVTALGREALLEQAAQELLQADRDGNGVIAGGRGEELETVRSPVARALYEYADHVNHDAAATRWGPAYELQGGLGVGYALRPAHVPARRRVSHRALSATVNELRLRLEHRANDLPQQSVDGLLARAKAAGLLPADAHEALTRLHAASEVALEKLESYTEVKERRLGREHVEVGIVELEQHLAPKAGEPGTLEHLLVAELARGGAVWQAYFDGDRRLVATHRQRADVFAPAGSADDAFQHYIVLLGRRAREMALLLRLEVALSQAGQANSGR